MHQIETEQRNEIRKLHQREYDEQIVRREKVDLDETDSVAVRLA